MQDISIIKKKILVYLLKGKKEITKQGMEMYSMAAEILAYQRAVIPPPYHQCTLSDFTGYASGEKVLSSKIVADAKQKMLDYCWSGVILKSLRQEDRDISEYLSSFSSMHMRKANGDNVIVFADAQERSGKTMCAAIVMKEAIKRRTNPSSFVETYQWVKYSNLIKMLISNDGDEIKYLQSDWLVVDDIVREVHSQKKQAFMASLLDPFFNERIENKLPTIFVFRFDIDKYPITDENFGLAVQKIANDKSTIKINLIDEDIR